MMTPAAHYKTIMLTMFFMVAFTVFMSGCESVLDSDFVPFESGGHHPFADKAQHGNYLSENSYSFAECTECHGADLQGIDNGIFSENGEKDRSCLKCHNREDHKFLFSGDWSGHPAYLRENDYDFSPCFNCHSNDPTDVETKFGKACYECHNRDNHTVLFPGSWSGHPDYLRENNWNIEPCFSCHANIPVESEIKFGKPCNSCHANPQGAQECNVCHGNFSGNPADSYNWAPPEDLAGNSSGSDNSGIGAHQVHLQMEGKPYRALECKVCHSVPASWNSDGHILNDETPGQAEVDIHFPETNESGSASYDSESNSCSSTYCHKEGNPVWTEEGGWTECNSCHGIPPGGDHYDWPILEWCYMCHGSVIDQTGTIIAPELHVNGVVDGN